MFVPDKVKPKEVATRVLQIMRTSVEAPEELAKVVPDEAYRNTFLKLTRNLAPTGKRYEQLDMRAAGENKSVSLIPNTRKAVGKIIQDERDAKGAKEGLQETLRGTLRAVHLDKDWIEITVDGEHVKINNVTDAVDDVIGPMINHVVIAKVVRKPDGKFVFVDVELDE